MNTKKQFVHQGQSFLDKVIELTGNVDNTFEMALSNGRSITDNLEIGTELSSISTIDKKVASLFNNQHRPATALSFVLQNEIDNQGIGQMEISYNFIVQ